MIPVRFLLEPSLFAQQMKWLLFTVFQSILSSMKDIEQQGVKICQGPCRRGGSSETAVVNSNVRQFAKEQFTVFRCDNCRSIVAADAVDLEHYYEHYPYKEQKLSAAWSLICRNYLRRLKTAGLKREHTILDYGCGSGMLISQLKKRGFENARGFDAYNDKYSDRGVLDHKYDCVILQDVIEHSEKPGDILEAAIELISDSGFLCIGTPNADRIDLGSPEKNIHCLHQPYHRHIFTAAGLTKLAEQKGLTLERFYDRHHSDTFWPYLNMRFYHYYCRLFDDTLDVAFDEHPFGLHYISPKALWLAFFGRLWPSYTEMVLILRKQRRVSAV